MILVTSIASGERELMSNVTALTLYKGEMTTGRRSVPIPQASCIGGTAKCPEWGLPNTLKCVNRGSNGSNIHWECIAEMHPRLKFGETTVACEGYNNRNDCYVLSGSCGVEYTLNWTNVESESDKSSVWTLLTIILIISLLHIYTDNRSYGSSEYLTGAAIGYSLLRLSRSYRGYFVESRGFGGTRYR